MHKVGVGGNGYGSSTVSQRRGGGAGGALGTRWAVTPGEVLDYHVAAIGSFSKTYIESADGNRYAYAMYGYGGDGGGTGATTGNNSNAGVTVLYNYAGGSSPVPSGGGASGGGGAGGPNGAGANGGTSSGTYSGGGGAANGGGVGGNATSTKGGDGGLGRSGAGGTGATSSTPATSGVGGGGGGGGSSAAPLPGDGGMDAIWTDSVTGISVGPSGGRGGRSAGSSATGKKAGYGAGGGGGDTAANAGKGGDSYIVIIYQTPDTANGTTTSQLDNVTAQSTAVLPIQASTTATLGALTSASAATLPANASAADQLDNVTSTATAQLAIQAASSNQLGTLIGAETGALLLSASVAKMLAGVSAIATATVQISGQLAAALGSVSVTSTGSLQTTVPWTPANLTVAPVVWLDSSDQSTITMNADGTHVNSIANKGSWATSLGNGTVTSSPTWSATGLNGLPALTFAGGQFLTAGYGSSSGLSTGSTAPSFMVAVGKASGGRYVEYGSKTNGGVRGIDAYYTTTWEVLGSAVPSARNFNNDALGVINMFGLDNGAVTGYIDGGSVETGTLSYNTSGSYNYTIGRGAAEKNFLNGSIQEVFTFNYILSDSDRQKLEGYLAWKWGMQSLLPTTHPYANAAPTVAGSGGSTGISATVARVLGSLTPSASAKLNINGASNRTLDAMTALSAASLNIAGTEGGFLGQLSVSSAAKLYLKGNLSSTLDAALGHGDAQLLDRGAAQGQLADATATSTAVLPISAAFSGALARMTTISAAQLANTGQGSGNLDDVSLDATVGVITNATVAAALDALAATISAKLGVAAQLNTTLAALGGASAARTEVHASIDQALASLTSSGTARLAATGTLTKMLGTLTTGAAGVVLDGASLERQLDALSVTVSGTLSVKGCLDQTLDGVTTVIATSRPSFARVAGKLGALTLDAEVKFVVVTIVPPERRIILNPRPLSVALKPRVRIVHIDPLGHNLMYSYPTPALPDEELDYEIDWNAWLQPKETIVSAVVTCSDPTTQVDRTSVTGSIVHFWVSGGTSGRLVTFLCTVETSLTRTEKVQVRLPFDKLS